MSIDHSASQATRLRRALAGDARLHRSVRELARQLMRDVIGTVLAGSAAEIAVLLREEPPRAALPPSPKASDIRALTGRGPRAAVTARAAAERPGRRAGTRARPGANDESASAAKVDRRSTVPAAHDPFAITSPGDLLASTEPIERPAPEPARASAPAIDAAARGEGEVAEPTATTAAPPRPPAGGLLEPPKARPRAADRAVATQESEAEAESERRPKIVLREGERLVSSGGSGVVIRRARQQQSAR